MKKGGSGMPMEDATKKIIFFYYILLFLEFPNWETNPDCLVPFINFKGASHIGPTRFLCHTPLGTHARTHTHTHTHGRTAPNERSDRRRGRYLHKTQQTHETNIHARRGIRTRDPSNQADADLRSRPYGHQDRLLFILSWPVLSAEHEGVTNCAKEE